MRTYPFPGRDAIEGVALKVDGSIVAVGYRGAAQDEQRQRFSDEAQRRSQCGLGAPTRGYLLPAIQGVATSGCAEHTTFCLSLTDEDGNTAPPITYGTGTSHPYDFDAVRDGGFILAGHLATCSYDCWDGWLVRVYDAGRAVWNVSFGEPNGGAPERLFEECYGVRTVPSGGYVTACGSGVEPGNEFRRDDPLTSRAYVVRVTEAGEVQWQGSTGLPTRTTPRSSCLPPVIAASRCSPTPMSTAGGSQLRALQVGGRPVTEGSAALLLVGVGGGAQAVAHEVERQHRHHHPDRRDEQPRREHHRAYVVRLLQHPPTHHRRAQADADEG